VPIVDANTLLGAWPLAEVELSVEALAAGMQSRGVSRSLVTHTAAIFYDSAAGNDQCVQLCRQYEPLLPVAVLNPLHYPACLDEARRCLDMGVQVFRLCPREHSYRLTGALGPLRDLMRALEPARLLLVDLHGLPHPVITADLEDLLPVPTALSIGGDALGTVIQVARKGPNVWVETSRLDAGGAIEAAVRHLGAERVIFGSGAPLYSLGSAVMSLQYAELQDAERAAIFEGNVLRALG
jgi:hypothetical protein